LIGRAINPFTTINQIARSGVIAFLLRHVGGDGWPWVYALAKAYSSPSEVDMGGRRPRFLLTVGVAAKPNISSESERFDSAAKSGLLTGL